MRPILRLVSSLTPSTAWRVGPRIAVLCLLGVWGCGCSSSGKAPQITCQNDQQCAPGYHCDLTRNACNAAVDAAAPPREVGADTVDLGERRLANDGGDRGDGPLYNPDAPSTFDAPWSLETLLPLDTPSAFDTAATLDTPYALDTPYMPDGPARSDAPQLLDRASPPDAPPPPDAPVRDDLVADIGNDGDGSADSGNGGSFGSDGLPGIGGVSGTGGANTGTGGVAGTGGTGDTQVNQPRISPTTSIITSSTPIVVSFFEPMETSSLVLSGSLGSVAHVAWDSTSKTLTLTPLSAWPEGANQNLKLSITDLAKNAIVPVDVVYSILDGVVYVKTTGSDANPGTSDSPKATIPAAITTAESYLNAGEVHVAQGTYNVSNDASTHIVMKPDIAVKGGYSSSSWATRDWNTYATTIQDIASTGGEYYTDKEVVYFGNTTNAQSLLEGFTIIGPSEVGSSVGVMVFGGSPTIRNNRIYAGATAYTFAYGIKVRGGSKGPLISHNTIYARGTGAQDSLGISVYQSSSRIEYNDIDGGAGGVCSGISIGESASTVVFANTVCGGSGPQTRAVGVSSSTSSNPSLITIENNVLNGGAGTNARGIYIPTPGTIRNNTICGGVIGRPRGITIGNSSAAITIENNIIFSGSSEGGYGIDETSPAPQASVKVRNNDIWNCPNGLYYYGSSVLMSATIADMEAYLVGRGTTASGNVSVDPGLVSPGGADNDLSTMNDNNWSLTQTSPVKAIGLNGAKEAWDFTTDVSAVPRTPLDSSVTGWSMGAYEVN